MKYMAIIDADEKPVSCEFIGCNGNVVPYLIGATTNIKALEQQSEDCVSRAEIKKIAKEMYLEVANMDLDVHTISDCISYTSSKCRQVLENKLQALPPVTPTNEIGVWVEERDDYGKVNTWHCSNCYERTGFYTDYASNFCRECGVKKIGIVKSDEEAKKFLEKGGKEK